MSDRPSLNFRINQHELRAMGTPQPDQGRREAPSHSHTPLTLGSFPTGLTTAMPHTATNLSRR